MKGRGPQPKPDPREEFMQRLRGSFRWVGKYADVTG